MLSRGRVLSFKRTLISLVIVATTSCIPRIKPTLRIPGRELSTTERQSACQIITTSAGQVSSVRMLVQVQAEVDGERSNFRYAIVTDPLGRMRIEALPPSGAFTLALLILDNDNSTLLNVQEKAVYRANDEQSLLKRFFGRLPFTKTLLRALITGRAAGDVCNKPYTLALNDQSGLLTITVGEARDAWIFEGSSGRLQSLITHDSSGDEVAEAIISKFAEVRDSEGTVGVMLPAQWEIALLKLGVRAQGAITFAKVTTNVTEALFKVSVPQGYKEDFVDD